MSHRLTPLAQSLPATVPFVGPEAQERQRGAPFAARLGANESVFGPSPLAIAAMEAAARDAWMYGDPEGFDLRADLAQHHGVAMANIVLGEGIDGLLGSLVRLLVAPGDAVVTSAGAYPTFNYHVTGYGGTLHTVPYSGDAEDPDALLAKARQTGAKVIYLANPDNPMGSHHTGATITDMLDRLPTGCLLCLDEAYADLAPPSAIPPISPDDPRVIRMRTFSKAHGLAGLRVGYAIGHPDLIAAFDRVRNHFGVGRIAQAGARAALTDRDWLSQVVNLVDESRKAIRDIAEANGLRPLPSATNFVTVDCGQDGAFARKVLAALIDDGIFVRMPGVAPLDRCIRIGCGTDADMARLRGALPQALARALS
ncbi:histidinol-phosphate aminotransferase [Jannaschia pagri]|uniref:Histidinol-phosphate aminotransferase n=1 Tax=Jannaschia pagri TaxID=2829797 RepID=A0ABQ4NKE6_9RHOB|nr:MULTISPECIES: pyridoxal phosphate-dependent aminotransferase [unclassified Jannaschia]GIT91061.1 histidinol-phosphate aminotransferase [Jannaschia sp. AI_61]GIT94893.1 histidinol-phosphate aminotransferase [Jannaschia sp. AI_62]